MSLRIHRLVPSGAVIGLILAALSPPGGAQSTQAISLPVGDARVDGSRLVPYDNAWLMSAHFKDGRVADQGVWTDMVRAQTVQGRKTLTRTQGLTYLNGQQSVTINTFDAATLEPIASEQRGRLGRLIKRSFSGTHIETRTTPPGGGPEQVSSADLPTKVFDFNGGMYGLMFAVQPLSVGMTGTLPSVNDATNDYDIVAFAVVRREKVRAGGTGLIDAWVVETGSPVNARFWIIDHAPYIAKLVMIGASGETWWEMLN
jgi:hypothetical protein